MKKISKLSLLAGAAFMLAPMVADAGGKDVVRDDRGNVVVNTFENCVLTKWDGSSNCAGISSEELTVYFGFDSAALTGAAKAKLNEVAAKISGSVKSVDIVGFADEIGNADYNVGLSKRRANAVRSYLNSKGINTGAISVEGLGEAGSQSACDAAGGNEKKACLWRDRRVELQLNY